MHTGVERYTQKKAVRRSTANIHLDELASGNASPYHPYQVLHCTPRSTIFSWVSLVNEHYKYMSELFTLEDFL